MMYPEYSRVQPGVQVLVPGIMTVEARATRHTAQAGVVLHSGSGQVWYSEPRMMANPFWWGWTWSSSTGCDVRQRWLAAPPASCVSDPPIRPVMGVSVFCLFAGEGVRLK